MLRTFVLSIVLFASLPLVTVAHAQGSAGGYGQGGGGGGGFGGMAGGRAGTSDGDSRDENSPPPAPRPENDSSWTARTAVLTPGDRVEYKFEVKAGETLLAAAQSEAFDPALAIVDPAGKELARNDDRAEGDQSPFLAFRFPAAGTYTLRVLSYRSAAGGKFTARFRTFVAPDAPVGKSTILLPDQSLEPVSSPVTFLRIAGKKGETYYIRATGTDLVGRTSAPLLSGVLGPTGVLENDLETIVTPTNRPIFRASRDGDYYVTLYANGSRRLEVDVSRVATSTIGVTGEIALDLDPGEVHLVEFPVKRESIVRTSVSGRGFLTRLVAPGARVPDEGEIDPGYGRTRMWTYFLPNLDNENDAVRIYRAEGTARLAVLGTGTSSTKIVVRNTDSLPEWTDGVTKPTLAIGESKLYLWRARKADLVRVRAESASFLPRLDLFDLNGRRVNTLFDRRRKIAADDLYFPDGGVYVVRLTVEGFGGSGVATLSKGAIPSVAYTLGTTLNVALDRQNYGLYEVNLEAGKRYALTISNEDGDTRVDLIDAEGRFLNSSTVSFERVAVSYFVPERTGRYRLWLRGSGKRTFRFEPFVAPTLRGSGGG